MRHKNFFRFLLIAVCLALSNSCADKTSSESDFGDGESADNVTALREYFESTSPALCQIELGSSSCDHDHSQTRSGSSPSWQSSNLVPDWEKAYTWDAYKRFYVEVPLKGDGIYRSSILKSGRHHRAYPVRSFLILVKEKATGVVSYHVVTTIVETRGRRKACEADFHYVGNSDFTGFLLFSKVDGTSLKALHIRNHKSHLIRIGGSPAASTRTSSTNTDLSDRGYTLSLTSSDIEYSYYESGGSGGGSEDYEDPICCAICGKLYDLAAGDCPNGCDVEVPSDPMILCGICWNYYNALYYDSCPNGCSPFACFICGKDPCICNPACERCGSYSCPGPWACSSNEDDCTGEKCSTCGGYKVNTRSSLNCPVCNCPTELPDPKPDPEETEQIIIDDSFENDERVQCVLNHLLNLSDKGFQRAIKKFDGEFPVSHLKFSLSNSLKPNVNASTLPPRGYVIEIQLNGNNLKRPNLSIVRTLAHEVIHAEMFRKLLEVANKYGEIDVNTLYQCLANNDYPGIFDYYSRYTRDDFQHEQMAQHYRQTIVSILKAFDDSLPDNVYESLAWGGLHETSVWKSLSKAEQDRINGEIDSFNNRGIETCS